MEQQQKVGMGMDTVKKNKRKQTFLFNSISGVLQLLLTAILIFICIPVFIDKLGGDLYGVFCIVSVVGNLAVFSNLSFDATLIKFLSEQGKSKISDTDIMTSLLLMLSIIVPLSFLVAILNIPILTHILDVPSQYIVDSSLLFIYLLAANFFLLLGKIFTAILDASNKMYLSNLALFIYSVIYWGGIIIVVLLGYGLVEVGQIILLAALCWFIIVLAMTIKVWGIPDVTDFRLNFKNSARKQLRYGLKIYTGSLLGFLYEPLSKILISNLFGVASVGVYEIALRIKTQLLSIFFKATQPLYPLIAELSDLERLKKIVSKLMEFLSYVLIPFSVIILFTTYSVIDLWIGGDDVTLISYSTIILVLSGLYFSVTVLPAYYFLRAKNHPDKEIYIQLVNVIVNFLFIMLTYKKIGFYSVLLGNAVALFASWAVCLYYHRKFLGVLPFFNTIDRLKYMSCLFITLISGIVVAYFFREHTFVDIIIKVFVIGSVSLLLFYAFNLLKKENIRL